MICMTTLFLPTGQTSRSLQKKPSVKAIDNDLALQYCQSKYDLMDTLASQLKDMDRELALLHKTYIRGLGEMKLPVPSYPDANFTIRLTYGNVKPYDPKDGVHYNYYTTTKGILEKKIRKTVNSLYLPN